MFCDCSLLDEALEYQRRFNDSSTSEHLMSVIIRTCIQCKPLAPQFNIDSSLHMHFIFVTHFLVIFVHLSS